jgi:hypothetical protein
MCIAAAFLFIRDDAQKSWTDSFGRMIWRMPPLDRLAPPRIIPLTRIWMIVLRGYLTAAVHHIGLGWLGYAA